MGLGEPLTRMRRAGAPSRLQAWRLFLTKSWPQGEKGDVQWTCVQAPEHDQLFRLQLCSCRTVKSNPGPQPGTRYEQLCPHPYVRAGAALPLWARVPQGLHDLEPSRGHSWISSASAWNIPDTASIPCIMKINIRFIFLKSRITDFGSLALSPFT